MYGELPGDLREQDETMGPPPSWYNMSTSFVDPMAYAPGYYPNQGFYQQALGGGFGSYEFGDREEEVEVDPVEHLLDLKFGQEMSKRIPQEAGRYTDVDPLSPLFRNRKAKYGFGDFSPQKRIFAAASLASSAIAGYHGYKRNRGSILWAAVWFTLGGALPIFVPTIAYAQGFGKPAKK